MEAGSHAAGPWLSHLPSKVSTVQSLLEGVINWPRHSWLSGLLGWSSSGLIPGWANVSLQAQRARQCRSTASILVAKWRGVSVWVFEWESEKKEEPVASERRYVPSTWWSLHFQSSKMHFKQEGGGGIYKVTLLRRMGFTKWYCMSAMCDLQKSSTKALFIQQEEGSSYKKARASNTDPPPKSRLTIYHFIVPSLSLFWNVFLVINLQNRHSWARSLPI